MTLNFQWHESRNHPYGGEYRATYRGLDIIADYWPHSENPFIYYEGLAPIAVYSDGRISEYSGSGGRILAPWESFSDWQVNRHWKEIRRILNISDGENNDIQAKRKNYGGNIAEYRRDYIAESFAGEYESRKLDIAAQMWNLIGVTADTVIARGYCQGDWAQVLVALTPSWLNATGAPDAESEIASAAKLYGAWAYGDVYAWEVQHEGDVLESCGGYFGRDHDESGLAEAATAAADYWAEKLASEARESAGRLKSEIAQMLQELRGLALPPLACLELRNGIKRRLADWRHQRRTAAALVAPIDKPY